MSKANKKKAQDIIYDGPITFGSREVLHYVEAIEKVLDEKDEYWRKVLEEGRKQSDVPF